MKRLVLLSSSMVLTGIAGAAYAQEAPADDIRTQITARAPAGVRITALEASGKRISVRGSESEPEIRQEPGTQLDFTYRKEFEGFGRPLTFSLEARNLLNTEYQEFQDEGNGRVYIDRYEPGSSVSFGLSTKF